MASSDSKTYLAKGGYLQKRTKSNLREADLEKDVQDLLPARYGVLNLNRIIRSEVVEIYFTDGIEMRKYSSLRDELYSPE
jgi:hypothetical protein